MNMPSASRAEGQGIPAVPAPEAGRAPSLRILVWDAPVRVFHWLTVLCFAGAWLSAESERFRLLHVTLGYTLLGLVAFRLLWGVVGSRHARFASFVRGPRAVLAYLRGLLRGAPAHTVGHNPAGALAIIAMLGLALAVGATGWAAFDGPWAGAGEALGELHEGLASAMLAVVGVHVLGVIASSWLHRENLVGAMFSGRKPGTLSTAGQGIRRAWPGVAALLLAAVLGFWAWQWQAAPDAALGAAASALHRGDGHIDGDGD